MNKFLKKLFSKKSQLIVASVFDAIITILVFGVIIRSLVVGCFQWWYLFILLLLHLADLEVIYSLREYKEEKVLNMLADLKQEFETDDNE